MCLGATFPRRSAEPGRKKTERGCSRSGGKKRAICIYVYNGVGGGGDGGKNIGFYGDFRRRMQNKHNSVYPFLLDCGGPVVSQRP